MDDIDKAAAAQRWLKEILSALEGREEDDPPCILGVKYQVVMADNDAGGSDRMRTLTVTLHEK